MKRSKVECIIYFIFITFISFILFILVKNKDSYGYELRGQLYVENCPQCKTYQGLECYEDLNRWQESIEKNCVKCDYSIREEH